MTLRQPFTSADTDDLIDYAEDLIDFGDLARADGRRDQAVRLFLIARDLVLIAGEIRAGIEAQKVASLAEGES